jgi:hypothetical protein
METVTIKGSTFELQTFTAGQLRHVVSAKLAAVEVLYAKLEAGDISPVAVMPELIKNCCEIVLVSLQNKYPDITIEQVESLTFIEIQEAVNAACATARMTGEAKPQRTRTR